MDPPVRHDCVYVCVRARVCYGDDVRGCCVVESRDDEEDENVTRLVQSSRHTDRFETPYTDDDDR